MSKYVENTMFQLELDSPVEKFLLWTIQGTPMDCESVDSSVNHFPGGTMSWAPPSEASLLRLARAAFNASVFDVTPTTPDELFPQRQRVLLSTCCYLPWLEFLISLLKSTLVYS